MTRRSSSAVVDVDPLWKNQLPSVYQNKATSPERAYTSLDKWTTVTGRNRVILTSNLFRYKFNGYFKDTGHYW